MRIITVNLPVSYLKVIDSLTGNKGLYPSRSELIRVAVRDFLIRELDAAKSFIKFQQNQNTVVDTTNQIIDNSVVRVPLEENSIEGITEYKTYRIITK
jgi:antitoxin ParD1/3/4